MVRSQFQHPALAQQSLQKDLALKDEEDLDTIPGWERFSPLKKKLLAVMPWFATGIDAYRYVKDDQETDSTKCHNALQQLRYKDKEFANALDYRRGSAVRMVRNLGADMLGKAILRLDFYIDSPDVPARDQLKAIEMVMNMNHIDSTNAKSDAGLVNYGEIQMFNMTAPAPDEASKPAPILVDNVIVVDQDMSVV